MSKDIISFVPLDNSTIRLLINGKPVVSDDSVYTMCAALNVISNKALAMLDERGNVKKGDYAS